MPGLCPPHSGGGGVHIRNDRGRFETCPYMDFVQDNDAKHLTGHNHPDVHMCRIHRRPMALPTTASSRVLEFGRGRFQTCPNLHPRGFRRCQHLAGHYHPGGGVHIRIDRGRFKTCPYMDFVQDNDAKNTSDWGITTPAFICAGFMADLWPPHRHRVAARIENW